MAKNDPHEDETIVAFTNAFHLALWDTFTGFSPRWRKYDQSKMDDISSRALYSLNSAGLIEVRLGVTVRWIGYPYLLQIIFEVCGKDTEAEVDRQVAELAEGAPGWVEEDVSQAQARIDVFTMAMRQSARGVSLSPPHFAAKDLLGALELLNQGNLQEAPPSVDLIDFQSWVPSDMQRLLWQSLQGVAMTSPTLMTVLDIGSKETLFGKQRIGGLTELVELDLVKNDKRKGGYYRPDHPPSESVP